MWKFRKYKNLIEDNCDMLSKERKNCAAKKDTHTSYTKKVYNKFLFDFLTLNINRIDLMWVNF